MANPVPKIAISPSWKIVFIDVVLCVVLILLVLVNPPKKDSSADPPGSVIIQASWAPDCDADVDLWVQAPEDWPVGYSTKSGKVSNLLRDDLGFLNDESNQNIEFVYGRWIADGEWVVNVHLYSIRATCQTPVPVFVLISTMKNGTVQGVATKQVVLERVNHEVTALRFRFKDNTLVAGSVHDLPMYIRTKSVSGGFPGDG